MATRRPKAAAPEVSEKDRECLPKIADALLAWRGSSMLAARDVLIWRTGPAALRVSFQGRAIAIDRYVYAREMLPNQHYLTDASLQKALGFEAVVQHDGRHATGIRGDLGQQLDEPEFPYEEIFRVIGTDVELALEPCLGKVSVEANLMPLEGAPLRPYYSAKKKKWMPAGEPPPSHMVQIEDRHARPHATDAREERVSVKATDMCRIYPRLTNCGPDIVALARTRHSYHSHFTTVIKNADFLVVHATMPTDEGAALVRQCGGWLFPSMAIGLVPSVTFGPLSLFASVDLVLNGLRPYRTGRAWPITVYDTDSWTMRARQIDRAAYALYKQLTGTYDEDDAGRYGEIEGMGAHQWVLGAPVSLQQFGGLEVKVLSSTDALARELAARWKIWAYREKGQNIKSVVERYGDTKHRYPYLEAKSNTVVDASCWKLAVVPRTWEKKARTYMKKTGIKAPLVVVDDPPSVAKHGTEHWGPSSSEATEAYAFSEVVARAAVAYADKHKLVRTYG